MTDAFHVTVEVPGADRAARGLDQLTGESLRQAVVQQMRPVLDRYVSSTQAAMRAGIALSEGYVSSRMEYEPPSIVPKAVVTAHGPARPNRAGLTILGHYSPAVTTQPAKRPRRSKGDSSRGIPAGSKAAGVQVEVTRGAPKVIPGAFTMKLRRGDQAGDQIGVFVRSGAAVRHLYGVSPYSLFRFQVSRSEGELADRLQDALGIAIDRAGAP